MVTADVLLAIRLWVYSHQAKAGVKAKRPMNKRNGPRINEKIKEHFSLKLLLSFDFGMIQ